MAADRASFMGTDRLLPLLMKLSIPAAAGMIVNSLYNVVDTIFVGRGVGPEAIAALSIAFPLQIIIGTVAHAFGAGTASIVSRRLGERRTEEAAAAAGTSMVFVTLYSIVAMAAMLVFAEPVLRLFGASPAIMPIALTYLRWVAIGFPILGFAMSSNGLIRAEGRARTAMVSMFLGTGLNILLDPIFIFGLGMGIRGAAIATVISQAISAFWIIRFYVSGRSSLSPARRHLRIRRRIIGESFALGLPNFIHGTSFSLLMLIINRTLGSFGGDAAIATYGMINRLMTLAYMPLIGLAQGFQPIAGYNTGAGLIARVRRILLLAGGTATALAALFWAGFQAFPAALMSMFTSDAALVASSARALRMYAMCMPLIGVQMIGSVYFQAVGRKLPSLLLTLSRQFIFLIPLVILLPRFIGIDGVWLAFPAADLLSTVVTAFAVSAEWRRLGRERDAGRLSAGIQPEAG